MSEKKNKGGHPTIFPGASVKISARITDVASAMVERQAERLQVTYSQAIEWLIRRGNRSYKGKV